MKLKTILFFMSCTIPYMSYTQSFSDRYTTEW